MKETIKKLVKKLSNTKFVVVLSFLWRMMAWIECFVLRLKWVFIGRRKLSRDEVQAVIEECTFIFKSFERQKLARRLYKSIQSYYPGARVIIADDSAKPLELTGENLEIVQLPFNSDLSVGLNRALERSTTPFVV